MLSCLLWVDIAQVISLSAMLTQTDPDEIVDYIPAQGFCGLSANIVWVIFLCNIDPGRLR